MSFIIIGKFPSYVNNASKFILENKYAPPSPFSKEKPPLDLHRARGDDQSAVCGGVIKVCKTADSWRVRLGVAGISCRLV
jgi:hypothetical protein